MGIALALLTAAAALATPTLPWFYAPALIVLALVARRHWIGGALGAAMVWPHAVDGTWGAVVLVAAVVVVAVSRRRLALAVLFVVAALVVKQRIAAQVLPAALEPVPGLVVMGIVLAGASCVGRAQSPALAIAGVIGLTRLAGVFALDGLDRLHGAARIDAVPLVWRGLAAEGDRRVLLELVRLAPDRDAVALAAGWREALAAGWRPRWAEGVAVPVARALEAGGRGGEALRLLARHPREGEVDWMLGLLERTQGVPVRWKGAVGEPTLPGTFAPGVRFETNGYAALEFTVTAPLATVVLDGTGTVFEGAPTLRVAVDGAPPVVWALDGPAHLALPGPWEAGPHRVSVHFADDRIAAGGDRNVTVDRVTGVP